MKADFWIERWKNNDTPWQQGAPEALLLRHAPRQKNLKVFVPLCGKTVDLLWLQEQGHQVYGVELSEIACRSFFEGAKIQYTRRSEGEFEIFESKNIKIWCGDFFKIQNQDFPALDFIYDRAALIALPLELREQYARRITELAKSNGSKNFEMLVLLKEKIGSKHEGPPFLVSPEELASHYQSDFKIETLEATSFSTKEAPEMKIIDTAYRLTVK